jgi:hypothetical protein
MTLAAIAAADGTVSRQTVTRALDEPECPNGLSQPTTIISKNGKSYPAKKPRHKSKNIYIHLIL